MTDKLTGPKAASRKLYRLFDTWRSEDEQGFLRTKDMKYEEIEAIIKKHCPEDRAVADVLMDTLNFVNGVLGMDAFEKERLKGLIKLAIAKRGMKLNETISSQDKAVGKLVEVLKSFASVQSPEADPLFYELNGGPVGVIARMVGDAHAALADHEATK